MKETILIKQRDLNENAKVSRVMLCFAVKTMKKHKTRPMKTEYLHTSTQATQRFQLINKIQAKEKY